MTAEYLKLRACERLGGYTLADLDALEAREPATLALLLAYCSIREREEANHHADGHAI